MKSLPRRLRDIADLLAALSVTNADLVAVSVYGSNSVMVHLRPSALLRVFHALRVPASRINKSVSSTGDLHVDFTARGAWWGCCVLADSEAGQLLRGWLASRTRAALASQPKLISSNEA